VVLQFGFGATGGPHFIMDPTDDNKVVKAITFDLIRPMGHPYLAASPDGRFLYISMGSNTIRSGEYHGAAVAKLNLETYAVSIIPHTGYHPIGIVNTADGRFTYVADGHGTHVTGIVTGNGVNEITNTSGYPSPNRAKGVSPGGGILSGKVCGQFGCSTAGIVAGIEWAVENDAQVINLSLGGGNFGAHCDGDFLAQQVNAAVDAGVVVVASAGNDNDGVSSPACASKAIAVGAVYHADIGEQDYSPTCIDTTTVPDQRVCFSNKGAALDLMAPGAAVLSSYSCHVATLSCASTWYAWIWGTSQSAPHVAGAAALILDANSSLTPAEVKSILESTARDLGPTGRDDLHGWGVIDVDAAVAAATTGVDIALTTDGSVAFGTVALSAAVDTTVGGIDDVQTVEVVTGPANLYVKTTLFTDGSNTWTLDDTTSGDNQVVWEFSTDGIVWEPFTAADPTTFPLDTNVGEGETRNVYFRLTMPTSTSSSNEHGATITVVAVAP
ncbi:hypothetical protein LCGC14_1877570, partial [marine sediment metagenome]